MIESAKKLGEISLAIFESIFASKIYNFHDQKSIIAYFNEFDESILTLIREQIKDEYEIEKLQDFIFKNPLLSERKYQFITEDSKNDFIDSFYKKNLDLKIVGSKRINHCLECYIDKINELLNNILSAEGKILLQQMNISTTSILEEVKDAKQEITETKQEVIDLKETIQSKFSTQETTSPSFYNTSRKNKLFFGRNDILNNAFQQLETNKLVFLTGSGGIGKSQIAREIVSRLQNKYQLILWISANTENELLEELNNVALHYNLINEKNTDFDFISSKLSTFINKYPTSLIVYDGVDDISINFLATKCLYSQSDIIITTQNSNIDNDEFPVIPVDVFKLEESKDFLLNNSSNRHETENDCEAATSLSLLLENYPLALEYARAYVNKMHISFSEYLEIYEKHKQDILNSAITSYKKTAYTTWKISFTKVVQQSPAAKEILNIISLFDSYDIPLYDIFLPQKIYSSYELNQIILTITNYSLFTMDNKLANTHGITQEFIRFQMQKDCEYQNYYEKALQLLSEIIPHKITSSSERDIVHLFIKHAIKLVSYNCNINTEKTIRLSANIASKLYMLCNYTEVINFIQEQSNQFNHSDQEFSICEMMIFAIQSYHYTGNDSVAFSLLTKYMTLTISSESLTDIQKCYLLSNYKNVEGIIQKDQGQLELCIKTFSESLNYLEKLGEHSDNDQTTNILNNIGNAYRNLGNLNKALEYYQQALSYANDDKHQLLRIYGNIGLTHKVLGNYELALDYFLPSLDYSVELGDKRNECIGLQHLGNCYICLHDYEKAIPFLEKSLKIADELNLIVAKINVYFDYGSIAAHHQNYTEAKQYWKLSLEKSHSINYQKGITLAKYSLSQLP